MRLVSTLALCAGQTKSPPASFASAGFFDLFVGCLYKPEESADTFVT